MSEAGRSGGLSIRAKIFLSHFLVICLPLGIVGYCLQLAVEQTGLYLSEWENARQSRTIATLLTNSLPDGVCRLDAPWVAGLLGRRRAFPAPAILGPAEPAREAGELRFLVTDERGALLFDSRGEEPAGTDYSRKRDVSLALADAYGSRTTLEPGGQRLFLYSAAPVYSPDSPRVIGAVSVSQPTSAIIGFLSRARCRLLLAAGGAAVFAALVALVLTRFITTPIRELTRQAREYRRGAGLARLASPARDEIGELARAFAELARRLEGKQYVERFVSDLSHELKSPLAAISGAAEILAEGEGGPGLEERARFLRNILKESRRLQDLVRDLLQLSRLDTGQVRPELAWRATRELSEEFLAARAATRARAKGVRLALRVRPGAREALLDQRRFEQLLGNLADNALDFAPAGGRVEIGLRRAAGYLVLEVADDGPGFAPESRARLFERFFSTPRPGGGGRGTGLGLCIVREIARAHGGGVRVDLKRARGARVRVFLPQREPPAGEVLRPARPAAAASAPAAGKLAPAPA